MPNYLIETYAARGDDSVTQLGVAAAQIASGVEVRSAVFAPDDEMCLWVLFAPTRGELERELERVGINGHIQAAVVLT